MFFYSIFPFRKRWFWRVDGVEEEEKRFENDLSVAE